MKDRQLVFVQVHEHGHMSAKRHASGRSLHAGNAGSASARSDQEETEIDQIESTAPQNITHDEDDVDAEPERCWLPSDRPQSRPTS